MVHCLPGDWSGQAWSPRVLKAVAVPPLAMGSDLQNQKKKQQTKKCLSQLRSWAGKRGGSEKAEVAKSHKDSSRPSSWDSSLMTSLPPVLSSYEFIFQKAFGGGSPARHFLRTPKDSELGLHTLTLSCSGKTRSYSCSPTPVKPEQAPSQDSED